MFKKLSKGTEQGVEGFIPVKVFWGVVDPVLRLAPSWRRWTWLRRAKMVRGACPNHVGFLRTWTEGLGSSTFTRRWGVAGRRRDTRSAIAFCPFGVSWN